MPAQYVQNHKQPDFLLQIQAFQEKNETLKWYLWEIVTATSSFQNESSTEDELDLNTFPFALLPVDEISKKDQQTGHWNLMYAEPAPESLYTRIDIHYNEFDLYSIQEDFLNGT